MPATRRSSTRQRSRTVSGTAASSLHHQRKSSKATSSVFASPSSSARISKQKKKTMVSTRSSTRAARTHPTSSASPSTSTSTRQHPTFPELVRARVAYSPAPSHASSSAASVASPATVTAGPTMLGGGRHPHWIQWPSQLAASSAHATAQGSRASSMGVVNNRFERGSTADQTDLGHYAALLQGALRKGRETTGSPA